MALSAVVDLTVTPITLTIVSDRRKVTGTITSAGDTATYTAQFPVTIVDSSGRTWTVRGDNGSTAVYTG